jgi:DnaJ-class molecular chaperone
MSDQTFYDILGVPKDAAEADIKKAYRSLSLKYHPDRNQTEEAKTKIQQINEAYETLGDGSLRKDYDMKRQFGGASPFQNMGGPGEFTDINNIFNMMFGGGGGGPGVKIFHNGMPQSFHNAFRAPQRPPPISTHIELTLEQSYSGCVHPVNIERIIKNDDSTETEKETIYVNIPAGINHNETVVLHDKGNIVNSICGYVNITIVIVNNTEFQRHGLDIVYNKRISLKEALCGFTFDINHPSGKKFAINNTGNSSIIKPNYRKIVPGHGMKRENNVGNMIVVFDIIFPDSLTPEQIGILSTGLP